MLRRVLKLMSQFLMLKSQLNLNKINQVKKKIQKKMKKKKYEAP